MRRALVGLVMAGAMTMAPGSVVAQDPPALQFALVVGFTDVGDALGAWGANILGAAERQRVLDAIETDRSGLAAVVPDACLLPTYVGYLEALTYAEVAVRLFEEFQLDAALTVQQMVAAKMEELDPASVSSCM